MKRAVLLAIVVVAISSAVSLAEGLPSKSKLAQLGLSSMTVASDEQGAQVRGSGYAALGGFLNLSNGGVYPFGYGFFPGTFGFPFFPGGSSTVVPINAVGGQLLPNNGLPAVASLSIPAPGIVIVNAGSYNGVNFNYSTSVTGQVVAFGQ